MQRSIEDVTTSASTRLDTVPGRIDLCLPALPDIGRVAASFIGTVVRAWKVETRAGTMGDAVRAVADELADRAPDWSGLDLSVELDDLDVYVRLAADVAPQEQPELARATEALLERATSSHHVALDEARLLVVLQTTGVDATTRPGGGVRS